MAITLSFNASYVLAESAVELSNTVQFELKNEAQQPYRIMVSKPEGDLPYTGGYPVVYLLDANAFFASFHEAKRIQEQFKHAIIVGIAYPTDLPHDYLRRAYDLSPPVADELNEPPQGGQDELLSFIEQCVMPEIEQRFKVDKQQQTLFGHSFGGMFTIYALFKQPELFSHYVSVSPSLWWHDHYLLAEELKFVSEVDKGNVDVIHKSLLVIMADNDSPQEIQDAIALERRLQALSNKGLRTSIHIEADQDHMSVTSAIESKILNEVLTARVQ